MDYNQLSFAVRLLNPLVDQPPAIIRRRTFERIPSEETARLLQLFFDEKQDAFLSRKKVFIRNGRNRELFALSVLFWGFPSNQHGRCTSAFQNWEQLIDWCGVVGRNRNITQQQFLQMSQQMQNMHRLGVSIFSKFLYFSSGSIDGHRCLILDNQVARGIQLLQGPEFEDLKDAVIGSHHRYYRYYPQYLAAMENLANQIGVCGDRMEYVLWLAGKKGL